ncbi:activity-dependent neuroprotector homeobox protein 2b [Tachysurus vachellii]|uniref:activity-dependent neuroprotector homeobox protein 2b n=1 Tax=Tachysurus vachellii TaxID=175792 RepID=UPI00296AA2BF|nr:activity-dependent neuroprotector homeobox protein 2b [Tachysurus vachellii]
MYQFPVRGLEKIRRTRKKVKNILSEFGLEECLSLCQSLQEFDPGDSIFGATKWTDLSDGFNGKWKKKWTYRTRGLCCSLCKFSTRSLYSFKAHIHRYHDNEQSACSLSSCSSCPFVGHPKVISRHYRLFHFENQKPESDTVTPLSAKALSGHTFQCRKCPFRDDLLYSMRKHVLINHYTALLNRFAGQRADTELKALGQMYRKFYCKVCGANADTSEHLLYHILTSDKHRELDLHINSLIFETDTKKPAPTLAPKIQVSPVITGPPSQPLLTPVPAPGTVLPVLANGGPRLLPPPNTTILPIQASALVQLASAEAKGLLHPGQPLSIQNVQAPRTVTATLPNVGGTTPAPTLQSVIPRQQPVRVGVPGPHHPPSRQVLLPPGVQFNVPTLRGPAPQPMIVAPRFPLNQPTPRGTMLTSQSLLSHLIPTGNKVDGLPTYTLAPLQVLSVQANNVQVVGKAPLPVSQNNGTHQQNSQDSKQTKKWVTCPICNELFPSNIYDSHVEIHKDSSKKSKLGLAARAPFLKKMPDKTVKCLMCKVLLSEKGIFEHLIHGLNCLFCPGMFYSIKQLVAHIQVEHNPTQKANCDFMRREYRLYTDESGHLLFPYFDINTTAPKEMMGEKELNLALVTNSLDLIFLKMTPMTPQAVCKMPVPKPDSLECVFCSEKLLNMECYQMHLREKHFIVPTVHAILKMPAYKCIYCGGVYTGKTTVKAISVHVSRCRSAPKTLKDAERIHSGLNVSPRISQGLISFPARQTTASVAGQVQGTPAVLQSQDTFVEKQSKLRLELAVKEAIEANKREREARLARKKRFEKERPTSLPSPAAEVLDDSNVQFALDPAGMELRSFEARREFVNKYFNIQPYPLKKEIIALSSRLLLNKTEVACQFGSKRTRCMKQLQRNKAEVLLGFNMAEVMKVKHNLFIPEIEPEKLSSEPEPRKREEITMNTNKAEKIGECLASYEG